MEVSIIAAVGWPNLEIGYINRMPWSHFKEDMKHFMQTTEGWPVVMGRGTADSISSSADNLPLKNRHNVVLSYKPADSNYEGVQYYQDLNCAIYDLEHWDKVFIIGGASIYKQAFELGIVDSMYLTQIYWRFPDATHHFPKVEWEDWDRTWLSGGKAEEHDFKYDIFYYKRNARGK